MQPDKDGVHDSMNFGDFAQQGRLNNGFNSHMSTNGMKPDKDGVHDSMNFGDFAQQGRLNNGFNSHMSTNGMQPDKDGVHDSMNFGDFAQQGRLNNGLNFDLQSYQDNHINIPFDNHSRFYYNKLPQYLYRSPHSETYPELNTIPPTSQNLISPESKVERRNYLTLDDFKNDSNYQRIKSIADKLKVHLGGLPQSINMFDQKVVS